MVDTLFKPVCLNAEAILKLPLKHQLTTQTHVFSTGTQLYYLDPLPSNSLYNMFQLYQFIIQEIYYIYLFACMCVVMCVQKCVRMEIRGHYWVSIVSYLLGPGNQTQIVRFGHKYFCLLRPIARPVTQHRFLSF